MVKISKEIEADTRRLADVEKLKPHAIARQLQIHHSTVRRILGLLPPRIHKAVPESKLTEEIRTFILEKLNRYPNITGTRLFSMAKERGYMGSIRSLRYFISKHRPKKKRKEYIKIIALPGEEWQIDWTKLNQQKIPVENGFRDVWLCVIVSAYSRAIFAEAIFSQDAFSLTRSLVRAACFFGGTARSWKFDNAKTVVVDRYGDSIRFHEMLVKTADDFRVELKVCNTYSPQEKGRVERAIQYIKKSCFWDAPQSIQAINERLREFCLSESMERRIRDNSDRTVRECFEEEQKLFLPLPAILPETDLLLPLVVSKTGFVRFDTNDYSIPSGYVGETVILSISDTIIRVIDPKTEQEIGQHKRCWGKKQTIEARLHREVLIKQKQQAKGEKNRQYLQFEFPEINIIIGRWQQERRHISSCSQKFWKARELYGDEIFKRAIHLFVEKELIDPSSINALCESIHRQKQHPKVHGGSGPKHPRDRNIPPHNLSDYDNGAE